MAERVTVIEIVFWEGQNIHLLNRIETDLLQNIHCTKNEVFH